MRKNLEKFMFNASEVNELHAAKEDILVQTQKFHIAINCCGFFEVNRNFAATVSVFGIDLVNCSLW